MSYGGNDPGLKSERRNRLDGGLNARSSPLTIDPSECTEINDLVFVEEGSLRVRKPEAAQLQVRYPQAASALGAAPTLTLIVGGGTLAAGDYEVRYWIQPINPQQLTGFWSAGATITGVGANDRIQVDVNPNNLGETVGQTSAGYDDPLNGNVLTPTVFFPLVLVRKTTDANFNYSFNLPTFTAGVQRVIVDSYSAGAIVQGAAGMTNFPLRFLVWHPGIQRLVGVMVDRAGMFDQALSAFVYNAIAKDKNGALHYWSRLQTRMKAAYVDQIMVIGDGLAKPKRLHWTGTDSTSEWRVIGSEAPASAPTLAVGSATGLTGAYQYKVAWVYNDGRADLTTLEFESNSSAASASLTVANQKIDVTIPANPDVSGLTYRRLYRTTAGGTVFFKHSDQAAGLTPLVVTDSTADTALGTTTPVDATGKTPNDEPPDRLDLIIEHGSRLFAVGTSYITDASLRILDSLPIAQAYYTKSGAAGTSESVNAWPSTFTFPIGDSRPPTNWISYNGEIIVFKTDRIGKVSEIGDDTFKYFETHQNVGAMRNTVVQAGAHLFFWEDARGPFIFDGYRESQIGYKIQPQWEIDRAAGFRPFVSWFDPDLNSVKWGMSNVSIAPPGAATGTASWKEYAFYLPTKAWTLTTSATAAFFTPRAITAWERAVLSADLGTQIRTSVFSQYQGWLYLDNNQADNPGQTGVVTVAVFFGDNWEMIKAARFLSVYYSAPVNVAGVSGKAFSILIQMATLHNPTFKTVATIASTDQYHRANRAEDGYASGTVLPDHVRVYDIPSDLIINLRDSTSVTADAKRERDWGPVFRFTLTGANATLRGISLKYKDESEIQKQLWPGT